MRLTKASKRRIFIYVIIFIVMMSIVYAASFFLSSSKNTSNASDTTNSVSSDVKQPIQQCAYDPYNCLTESQKSFIDATIANRMTNSGLGVYVYIHQNDYVDLDTPTDSDVIRDVMSEYNLLNGHNVLLFINNSSLSSRITASPDIEHVFTDECVDNLLNEYFHPYKDEAIDSGIVYTINNIFTTYENTFDVAHETPQSNAASSSHDDNVFFVFIFVTSSILVFACYAGLKYKNSGRKTNKEE